MPNIYLPIWKDTFYTAATSASPLTYYMQVKNGTITVNGVTQDNYETIFNGKAWAAPQAESLSININRIAQDYMEIELPVNPADVWSATTVTHPNAYRYFRLYDGDNNLLATYNVILDWSYRGTGGIYLDRSHPINGKYTNGMVMFSTIFNGSQSSVSTIISRTAADVHEAESDTPIYTKETCVHNGGWALYYLNRSGGYDAFLIEGKVTRKDSYKKYYVDHYVSNTSVDFGKQAYNNEITLSWELNTGWLSDDESEKLAFNLLSSNQVYLHDINSNLVYPVVITDADVTYKTRDNQNKRMYNYTINIEGSQKQQNI